MPPRKRARQTVDSSPPKDAPELATKSHLPPDANTGVVFELPNEIWLEILSYFSSVRIPTLKIFLAPLLSSSTLERAHALRALSQTCRAFRALFLPELWERFEVCATPKQIENPQSTNYSGSSPQTNDSHLSGAWYKYIAEALEKRSNGLMQSPDHVKYVRTVSVALTRCKAATVLNAFVRCLKVLPNLHTLQILRAHTQMTTHLKNAFETHKISQVHTVVLPNHAHNVLRACPEVRVVMCNYDDGGKLIGAITKECKKVQVLRGFSPDVNMMKRIIKGVPNLEEISLRCLNGVKIVDMLSSTKRLRAIELCTVINPLPDTVKGKQQNMELKECIDAAKKILLDKASGKDEKEKEKMWLRVRYHESRHRKESIEEIPLGLVNGV